MRWRNVLAPAHGFTLPTPFADSINAASLVEIAAPSHGAQRLAAFYLASGSRPHPTAIIHHGFPGYEQNLDLAQTLRRGGQNSMEGGGPEHRARPPLSSSTCLCRSACQ